MGVSRVGSYSDGTLVRGDGENLLALWSVAAVTSELQLSYSALFHEFHLQLAQHSQVPSTVLYILY